MDPRISKPKRVKSVKPRIRKLIPPINDTGIACMVSVATSGLGCIRRGYNARRNTAPSAPAPTDVIVMSVPRILPDNTVNGACKSLNCPGDAIRLARWLSCNQ